MKQRILNMIKTNTTHIICWPPSGGMF